MILVTGATGNVGRPLVDALLAAGAPVRALTRDPARADLPDGVETARTDELPLDGVDAVFLNPAVFWNGVGELLDRAAKEGVRRIVTLSSASALTDDPENFIAAHHRDMEAQVTGAGVEFTHLRPEAFAANCLQWAEGIRRHGTVLLPYPQARTTPIHEADIAAVAAQALLTDELLGAFPLLTGPRALSFAEQVRLLSEALGREPGSELRVERISHDSALEGMIAGGVPHAAADTLLKMFREATDGAATPVSPEVERITGRPARDFAEWAEEHVTAFR
ncbi:NAD(P)H-binding protein [Streptomyces sporangiiformans]|uniref:NAD-dependent epimerase/dehydratase family protein n=1 Tax=Streptomyces sporangiiformans TaxID=2315329 RepID=A0A505DAY1_9ACTN|nr:NAD(P)H-binding protein [Streptomyces sporangiiformans]TPQ20884.1 NAD-dependent epimerase/dehydratase family protein [Streptomyces sporangiiformans]